MVFFFAGLFFGYLIGYLCSKIFHPSNLPNEDPNTFTNISTLIALILGAGVLAVFQPGGVGFLGYTMGIFSGFFTIPFWRFIRQESKTNKEQREKDYEEEIMRINSSWARIERTINHKLQRRMRQNEHGIIEAILPINDLNELGYSVEGKLSIMQAYAQANIARGVELKSAIVEREDETEEVFYLYQLGDGKPLPVSDASSTNSSQNGYKLVGPIKINSAYLMGNDSYDESFSLVSPSGEFLGEFGIGICETLGAATPKQVVAFEIWLFDKNETKTQTKVITSSYAFTDDAARQRLTVKGELHRAQKGRQIILETNSLQIVARVDDLAYGIDASMPKESYFDQIKLEFIARAK